MKHAFDAVVPVANRAELPSMLLGIHSARFDMSPRDQQLDETLGLNCAWYADILMTLTEGPRKQARSPIPPTVQPEFRWATSAQ